MVIKEFAQHEKSKEKSKEKSSVSRTGFPGRVLKSMKLGISRVKWDTWTALATVIKRTRKTVGGDGVP